MILKILSRLILLNLVAMLTVRSEDDYLERENANRVKLLKQKESFTVIAPKHIKPLSDFHVLVNLANTTEPATIDLQITGGRDSDKELSEVKSIFAQPGETQTVKFLIGDWPPGEYLLTAKAETADRSWNFTGEANLLYSAKRFSTFIQTDKAIYKPGQLVHLRALFVDHELKPFNIKDGIDITIKDPNRNIIKQWTKQSNYRGLLSQDLQLSEDPMYGAYTIEIESKEQRATKDFSVAEYVLPTFGVEVDLPGYATYNDSNIVASVKASYTYGKPVNGHVTLTVQPLVRYHHLETKPLQQTQHRARLVNGVADINVPLVKDLKLKVDSQPREIEFFALVEEDFTGRKYNKTSTLTIYDSDFKIELLNKEASFKPSFDNRFRFKVTYQDGTPVEDNGPDLEIKYTSLGNVLEIVKLQPVGGLVESTIRVPNKVKSNSWKILPGEEYFEPVSSIEIDVKYRNRQFYAGTVLASLSDSDNFMQITLPQLERRNSISRSKKTSANVNTVNLDDDIKVRVKSTEAMQQVICHGSANGDIIFALSKDAKNETEFEFDFKIDQKMIPETKILCLYVRPENKEIVADLVRISVNNPMKNVVKMNPSRTEAKPGQEVEVEILTKPSSLVGLLAVDQSALLLKSGNDITQQDVNNELKSYSTSANDRSDNLRRGADSLLREGDVVVITNNQIGTVYRPVDFSGIVPLSSSSKFYSRSNLINPEKASFDSANSADKNSIVIRSVFPETWLWENGTASLNGSIRFKSKIPDTITSWVLSAFSMNENYGLGLSQPKTSIKVFRPFFIKLNLPYSIIRGEIVNIQAVINNYSKRPTTARVTLENKSNEFEFVEAANNIEDERIANTQSETRLISIPAEGGAPVSFLIRPKRAGHIDIKMVAQSDFAGDGIVKKLLVKPEGQTQYLNKGMLISLAEKQAMVTKNVSIDVPQNAVPESQKVFVSVIGDVMGSGLSNVDDLLRLPYGCGEQNMINLVPNIMILNYLKKTNRLKDTQRAKAMKNIETGYQRQLKYQRHDGSFSAFGNLDNIGSVWLTAYVLKTFQRAKSIITVDENVIKQAADFIAQHSNSDGSIEEVGMLYDKELKSNSTSPSYLTAYSMIALLQQPIQGATDNLNSVLQRGLDNLESKMSDAIANESPYDLAMITYALQLADRQEPADRAYEQLWLKAQEANDMVWWERKKLTESKESGKLINESESELNDFDIVSKEPRKAVVAQQPPLKPFVNLTQQSSHLLTPDGLSVEMTSLALMSTVRRGELERALPIVKWLTSQQNSNGGFASTQDTVLAIEALAAFAEANAALKQPQSVDIDLVYPRGLTDGRSPIRRNNIEQLLISQTNSLVQQQTRLPDNTSWVQIRATGTGTAVVYVSWQYNLLVSAEKPAFYLNPIVDKTSNSNYLQLSVCTYYKAGDSSNMAVMEVELPSGYVADVEALPGLRGTKHVKRVDTNNGDTKVIIYFDKVTRDELCLTVPAHRVYMVSNNKPVPVSIYDYYNRQQAARIFYEPKPASSCDICDSDTCKQACSTKPQKSERLISIHEQRNLRRQFSPTNSDRFANLRVENGTQASNYSIMAHNILPLAPVFTTLMSTIRNLYH